MNMNTDNRVSPQAPEIEEAILGACLTGDRTADPVCSVGTDFYGEKDLHGQTE